MSVAAIDQGTTSTRIVIRGAADAQVAHSVTHKQHYPNPGWVEHDPEELLANIRTCLEAADDISDLALANQGESCLAWDGVTKKPISPVIVWQDQRTVAAIERLKADGADELTLARAGLPLDSYFSASKLRWILCNVEDARHLLSQQRLRLGTTDAFFLDRLTGRFVTDVSTASRTSLMNLRTGQWDLDLCSLFGVPIEALPVILPTVGDFGAIGKAHVRVSVVDQQAALFGHGCRKPGEAKITFGTGAFAQAITGQEIITAADQGLLATLAWQRDADAPLTYALEGGVYNAGSAINWGRNLGLFSDFSEINSFGRPPAIERGLVFVPALSGLASPHWDRTATGTWLGLSLEHDRLDLVQAMLEGIAMRTVELLRAIGAKLQISSPISIDGGLSDNGYFVQTLATALAQEIRISKQPELSAIGAMSLIFNDEPALSEASKTVNPGNCASDEWLDIFQSAVDVSRSWKRNAS
ncbi:MAG: glycerol kinase [Hyphomicrobiales bacterium]|nr:glycerol kinase [Hyphomicrobiales bacterium]